MVSLSRVKYLGERVRVNDTSQTLLGGVYVVGGLGDEEKAWLCGTSYRIEIVCILNIVGGGRWCLGPVCYVVDIGRI